MKLLRMGSPAMFQEPPLLTAGVEDSAPDVPLDLAHPEGEGVRVAALEPFLYQRMEWCVNCGGAQLFIEVFEFPAGRLGYCLGCESEKFIPWTRTNSEVA